MEYNMNVQHAKYMDSSAIARAQQEYLAKIYAWMVGGLIITALTAWYTVASGLYFTLAASSLMIVLIIAEFGLVIALSGWVNKMSVPVAAMSFLGYSLLNGLTLSVILIIYTEESVYSTFFIAAAMFASLSAYGYFTKKDLSGVGRFMMMGLVGIIIASLVQFLFFSSALNFIISFVGVIVFAGLTAWDTQKLKEMYVVGLEGGDAATKSAIIGALVLYLDFINLFLFLLRIFGRRD